MKSRNSAPPDGPLIRIRVKERVRGKRSGGPNPRAEKIILIILGACLGLGIGYLVAGKLMAILNPPLKDLVVPVERVPTPQAGATPPGRIDFDLRGEGN